MSSMSCLFCLFAPFRVTMALCPTDKDKNLDFVLPVLRIVYGWLIEHEGAPPIKIRVNSSSLRGPWHAFREAIDDDIIKHAIWWRWYMARRIETPCAHLGWGQLSEEELEALLE